MVATLTGALACTTVLFFSVSSSFCCFAVDTVSAVLVFTASSFSGVITWVSSESEVSVKVLSSFCASTVLSFTKLTVSSVTVSGKSELVSSPTVLAVLSSEINSVAFEMFSVFESSWSENTVFVLLINTIVVPTKTETTPIVSLRIDHLCLWLVANNLFLFNNMTSTSFIVIFYSLHNNYYLLTLIIMNLFMLCQITCLLNLLPNRQILRNRNCQIFCVNRFFS